MRMRDLLIGQLPALGGPVSRAPITEAPLDNPTGGVPEENPIDTNAKAMLMNISKQMGEAYNMLGDGESVDAEVQDQITQMAQLSNGVYMALQYKKTAASATSLGDGEQSPALQAEALEDKDKSLDAEDSEVRDAKKDWVNSMVRREKAEAEAAEDRQDYTDKLNTYVEKKKKVKRTTQ